MVSNRDFYWSIVSALFEWIPVGENGIFRVSGSLWQKQPSLIIPVGHDVAVLSRWRTCKSQRKYLRIWTKPYLMKILWSVKRQILHLLFKMPFKWFVYIPDPLLPGLKSRAAFRRLTRKKHSNYRACAINCTLKASALFIHIRNISLYSRIAACTCLKCT